MRFFCQSESFIEDVLRRESDLLLGSSMGEQHRDVWPLFVGRIRMETGTTSGPQ